MSNAIETQGFKLEIAHNDSPLAYTEVKEITNFQIFDGEAGEIDTTHLRSTAKEFLMGLQDFGNNQFDANFLPDDPGQVLVRTAKTTRLRKNFRMTFSDGTIATFQGFAKSAPMSGGVDAKVDTTFSIRVTGEPVFT